MATIICLHCSGSSGRQWARLGAALAPGHAVHTPNLIGYGSDGPSRPKGDVTLDAEAARIELIMNATHGPAGSPGASRRRPRASPALAPLSCGEYSAQSTHLVR